MVLAGSCAPAPLPCTSDATCSGGVCADGFCAFADNSCLSGLRYHASAGQRAGDCTSASVSDAGTDSGSDGANGPDPIYVLAATQDIDASAAMNDVTPPCADAGGVDVMFKLVLTQQRRVYIDT